MNIKLIIFCDGDFWHGHNWVIRGYGSLDNELKRYSNFWTQKIKNNIERDMNNNTILLNSGWTVKRFWESDIIANVSECADIIEQLYKKLMSYN